MKTPTQLDRVRFDPIRIYDETNAHTNYHSIISLDWVQITLFPTQIWPGKSREIPRGQEIFKVTSDNAQGIHQAAIDDAAKRKQWYP